MWIPMWISNLDTNYNLDISDPLRVSFTFNYHQSSSYINPQKTLHPTHLSYPQKNSYEFHQIPFSVQLHSNFLCVQTWFSKTPGCRKASPNSSRKRQLAQLIPTQPPLNHSILQQIFIKTSIKLVVLDPICSPCRNQLDLSRRHPMIPPFFVSLNQSEKSPVTIESQ